MFPQATVSTNTPRSPVTPLSLKLRASVFKNEGKLGMASLEALADDEPSEVQRPCSTIGKLLAPLAVDDALAFNACTRWEDVDARSRYCWIGCAALGGEGSDADGESLAARGLSAPLAALATGTRPSCVNADAIAEASGSAAAVDESVVAAGADGGDFRRWPACSESRPLIGCE